MFDLAVPSTRRRGLAFLVSVALGIGGGLRVALPAAAHGFWLLDVRGTNQLGWLAAQFLSGAFIPIVLLPGPGSSACAALLPFASMLQVPVEVWLGRHEGGDLVLVWALQAGVGRSRSWWRDVRVMARAVRRVVVQGG